MRNNQANTITTECALPVEALKKGEFVKRISVCKTCNGDGANDRGPCADCATKGYTVKDAVYMRGEYDRGSQRYSLTDFYNTNREVFVKRGTRLFVGFSF